jgi:tetratricopeptide (TPR) repeat protein
MRFTFLISLLLFSTTFSELLEITLPKDIDSASTPKIEYKNGFEAGVELYKKGEYDSALIQFSSYLESEGGNSALYYNMGNAAYRLNRLGEAMLFYKRAKLYAPKDEDIIKNIRFVESELVDDIPVAEKNILVQSLEWIHKLLPISVQIWVVFVCSIIFLLLFAVTLFKRGSIRNWSIYVAAIVLIFTGLIATSMTYKIIKIENSKEGVVLVEKLDAYSAPRGNKLLFTAHEGTSFQIGKSSGNWVYISLANGVSGWIDSELIGVVQK